MSVVRRSPAPGVVVLTLDDPATRNALTTRMVDQLHRELDRRSRDAECRVVILTGSSSVFSSGGDTRRMGSSRLPPAERKEAMWSGIQSLVRKIDTFEKPLIAAVNGPAVGAGLDLALHCDLRLMADDTYIRAGYIDLAVVPGAGAAYILPRMIGTSRSLELLWTGRRIHSTEAHELGLIQAAVPPAELMERAVTLASTIADKPAHAVRLIKRLVRQPPSVPLATALDLASSHFSLLQETEEHAEGVSAARARRTPRFHKR